VSTISWKYFVEVKIVRKPTRKREVSGKNEKKETGLGGCRKRGKDEKEEGKGSVGRSVGRRFHFVSLPACGGAIAAALCQSVTLSRHPFYLAKGCPAHSTSYQPWYASIPLSDTRYGPRVQRGSSQGLPDWLPFSVFFFFVHLSRFLSCSYRL